LLSSTTYSEELLLHLRSARAAVRRWNGGIRAGSAPLACSSSDAVRERSPTTARFCECGGRLRYRDARRHSMPGLRQGHRWVCESCSAIKTRWEAATPEERERERAQSRRASAKYRGRIRAIIAEAKNQPARTVAAAFRRVPWTSTMSVARRSSRSPKRFSAPMG